MEHWYCVPHSVEHIHLIVCVVMCSQFDMKRSVKICQVVGLSLALHSTPYEVLSREKSLTNSSTTVENHCDAGHHTSPGLVETQTKQGKG